MNVATKPMRTKKAVQAADASSYRQEMLPLPLRVAKSQYERLSSARDRTGISIQEHVRRGIDLYLAVIEREAIELGLTGARESSGSLTPERPVVVRK